MSYGTYETDTGRPMLRFERRIAHSVEDVWRAVTQPQALAKWFPCQVEVELALGGRMKFTFADQPLADAPSTMLGEVTELDPPVRFSFLWGEDHLHFALEPIDDETACMLRFSVELAAADKAARDGAGWHVCLDALEQSLDLTTAAAAHGPERWRSLYSHYEEAGFPVGAALPG